MWHASFTSDVHPSLRFASGRHGYGGFATADIHSGTTLMSLPYDKILSEPYALSTEHGRVAWELLKARHPKEVTGRIVMYLVMVAQRAGVAGGNGVTAGPTTGAGSSSSSSPAASQPDNAADGFPFDAYLRSLPQVYDDPIWWSREELSWLQGTNLHQGALHRRAWLRRIYDVLFPALSLHRPDLFPERIFTWSAFRWAHSAFSSRGFPHILSVPPVAAAGAGGPAHAPASSSSSTHDASVASHSEPPPAHLTDPSLNPFQTDDTPVGCMLPVLDILNHRGSTPITWLRREGRVAFVVGGGGDVAAAGAAAQASSSSASSLAAAAPVAIPAGSEVFNNYGAKSNEELILGFGFVIDEDVIADGQAGDGQAGDGVGGQRGNLHDTLSLQVAIRSGDNNNDAQQVDGDETGEDGDPDDAAVRRLQSNIARIVSAAGLPTRFVLRRPSPSATTSTPSSSFATGTVDGLPSADSVLPDQLLMLMRLASLTVPQITILATEAHQHHQRQHQSDASQAAHRRHLLTSALSQPVNRLCEERALLKLQSLLQGKVRVMEASQPQFLVRPACGTTGSSADRGDFGASTPTVAAADAAFVPVGSTAEGASSSTAASPSSVVIGATGTEIADAAGGGDGGDADAAAGAADSSRHSYRRHMARVYVAGQASILACALREVAARLDSVHGLPLGCPCSASNAAGGAAAGSALQRPLLAGFPGVGCKIGYSTDSGHHNHSYVTADSLSAAPGVAASAPLSVLHRRTLLSFPIPMGQLPSSSSALSSSVVAASPAPPSPSTPLVLCPATLPSLCPAVASILADVPGLRLPVVVSARPHSRPVGQTGAADGTGVDDVACEGDADEEGSDAVDPVDEYTLHTSFIQLALAVVMMAHDASAGAGAGGGEGAWNANGGGSGGRKRKRASTADNVGAHGSAAATNVVASAMDVWSTFLRGAMDHGSSSIRASGAGGSNEETADTEEKSSLHAGLFTDIVQPLVSSYPKIFKKKVYSMEAWLRACRLVSSFSVPLSLPALAATASDASASSDDAGDAGEAGRQRRLTLHPSRTVDQLAIMPLWPPLPPVSEVNDGANGAATAGTSAASAESAALSLRQRLLAADPFPAGARWATADSIACCTAGPPSSAASIDSSNGSSGFSVALLAPCDCMSAATPLAIAVNPSFVSLHQPDGVAWSAAKQRGCTGRPELLM